MSRKLSDLPLRIPTDASGSIVAVYNGKNVLFSLTALSKWLNKSAMDLDLVDNTPDSLKPVSVPQQEALNSKASLSHTHSVTDITDFEEEVRAVVAATVGATGGLVRCIKSEW